VARGSGSAEVVEAEVAEAEVVEAEAEAEAEAVEAEVVEAEVVEAAVVEAVEAEVEEEEAAEVEEAAVVAEADPPSRSGGTPGRAHRGRFDSRCRGSPTSGRHRSRRLGSARQLPRWTAPCGLPNPTDRRR
jgi:hypothetical protein